MSIECGNATLLIDVQIGRAWMEGNKFNTLRIIVRHHLTNLTYIKKNTISEAFVNLEKSHHFIIRGAGL